MAFASLEEKIKKLGKTPHELFETVTKLRRFVNDYYQANGLRPDYTGVIKNVTRDLMNKGVIVARERKKFALLLSRACAVWTLVLAATEFVDVIDPESVDESSWEHVEKLALKSLYPTEEAMGMAIKSLRSEAPDYFNTISDLQ